MRRYFGMVVLLVAVMALVVGMAAGCSSTTKKGTSSAGSSSSAKSTTKSKVPVYTQANTNITAAVGSQFIIQLSSNPTTGYQWQITGPLSPAVKKVSSTYVGNKNPSSAEGVGGVEKWTFKAVSAGQASIQMEYIQAGSTTSAQTLIFSVTVK